MKIEQWPLEKPIPYARNARVCPESAIAKVAASIHEFGFKNPILVDGGGVIIAGHTRLLAAQRLGLETVPVVVASDLSAAQVKAYRLADNRTAQETSWDYEMLEIELQELVALEYDVVVTGFDAQELLDLKGDAGLGPEETQPVPEPPEEPISKLGDIWLLGDHRLMCGDSTDAGSVERLMNGARAALMFTDPPYLVDYDGGMHPSSEANGGIVNGVRVGHDEKK
jgi:ParB-like chromosome segregation protein Spo0J